MVPRVDKHSLTQTVECIDESVSELCLLEQYDAESAGQRFFTDRELLEHVARLATTFPSVP